MKTTLLFLLLATAAFGQVDRVTFNTQTNALINPSAANLKTANSIQSSHASLSAITANTGTLSLSGVTLTIPEAAQFGTGKRAIIGTEASGTVTLTYPSAGNFLQLGRLRVTGVMESMGNFWAGGIETPYLGVGSDPANGNTTLFMHNNGSVGVSQVVFIPEFAGLAGDLDGQDEMTFNEAPQTLKNKTINAANNGIFGLVPQHINMSGNTSRLVGVGQNVNNLTDPGAREITLGTGLAMVGNSLVVTAGGTSTVKLTADLAASSSTTSADATGLVFAVNAGTYYSYEFVVVYQTAATTTGIALGITYPTATLNSTSVNVFGRSAPGSSGNYFGWFTASGDRVISTSVEASNTSYQAIIRGVLSATASGNLQVQFASEVGGSNVTIKQGSFGILTPL